MSELLNEIGVLCDILNEISVQNIPNTTIYVAIGSAAHSIEQNPITKLWNIDPKNEQEFPLFLKSLKTDYPFDPLHIFLIDPHLENPPFVVCDGNKQLGTDWTKIDSNHVTIYENKNTNVTVYSARYGISLPFERFKNEACNDSTAFFDNLNKLAIDFQWLVIVNDFSGRYMSTFAEYYDHSLIGHKNHIIYGLGMRIDGGCRFDLTMPICDFIFNHNGRGITVFNPFDFEDDYDNLFDTIQPYLQILNSYQCEIIKQQTQIFIKSKKSAINSLVSMLRKAQLFPTNANINSYPCDNNYVEQTYNININYMLTNNMSDVLVSRLFEILSEWLIKYISPIAKDNKIYIVNVAIDKIKNTKDPYNWSTITNKLCEEYDPTQLIQ